MTEARGHLRLAKKALGREHVVGQIGTNDFDDDVAFDLELLGFLDRAHPARPEFLFEKVATVELLADEIVLRLSQDNERRAAGSAVGLVDAE